MEEDITITSYDDFKWDNISNELLHESRHNINRITKSRYLPTYLHVGFYVNRELILQCNYALDNSG